MSYITDENFKKTIETILLLLFFTTGLQTVHAQFALDNTYGSNGSRPTFTNCSTSMMIEANKLMVASGSNNSISVAKYNDDSTFDTSFAGSGTANFTSPNGNDRFAVFGIREQPDHKIVVVGRTHLIGGFSYYYNFFLTRFNQDGTVDTSFGNNGLVVTSLNSAGDKKETFLDVFIDANGNILAAGYSEDNTTGKADAVAMRFLSDGSLDNSFATNGIFKLALPDADSFNRISVLADNSIFLTGTFTVATNNTDMIAIKLTPSGTYESTFGNNGSVTFDFNSGRDSITDFFEMPETKIMLVGSTSAGIAFVKITPDGNLDTSFSGDGINVVSGNVPLHNSIGAQNVAWLPDGKYLVFSASTRNDNSSNNYDYTVKRLNADTSADTGFANNGIFTDISTTTSEYAQSMQVQTDGKVLLMVQSWNTALVYTGSVYRYMNAFTLQKNQINQSDALFRIFPNPTSDFLNIGSKQAVDKVEIYNLAGRKIRTITGRNRSIDVSSIAAGSYFIKVYSDQKTFFEKFIKK